MTKLNRRGQKAGKTVRPRSSDELVGIRRLAAKHADATRHAASRPDPPTRMIQIRNVPDHVHRQVKARAALAGTSLSDYLLREIERLVERPTREELLERLRSLPTFEPREPIAEAVAAEREGR
jgi:antitoxin FitA